MKKNLFLKAIFTFLFIYNQGFSQCVTTFPYSENFEAAPAWTVAGVNSDWAWGTPAHPILNSAGGGTKSWCVGGLTGSFYNFSQQSTLTSPCFNFSTLSYPWISLKIFWEDEWRYDGLVLQSSINGGATWTNVGAFGDAPDCNTANWYTYGSITWLTTAAPKHGWTGRTGATAGPCQGGNGSLGWVTAKHCLVGLANQPNVMLRFLFGSGTTCNSFDGIAIDDIYINNGLPHLPNFNVTCTGAGNYNFTPINPACPVVSTYTWNFGDPASGAANVSSATNPTHVFSAPGVYSVSLSTGGGQCNPPGTITQTVSVSNVSTAVVSQSINCFGGTGTASVNVVSGVGPFVYSWLPSGGNASTSNSLPAGNYSVSVTDGNNCVYIKPVVITQPAVLTALSTATNIVCFGAANGIVSVTASGGTPGYTYTWSPIGGNTALASALTPGTYTVMVKDANNCTVTANATITQPASSITAITSATNIVCFGAANGIVSVAASGGTPGYTYTWSPTGGNATLASALIPGTFTVMVKDANNCTVTANATITQPASSITAITSATNIVCFGAANGTASVTASGGTPGYTYTWSPIGGNTALASALTPGTYTVMVKDANNCTVTANATITQPASALASAIIFTNATCGMSNGSALVNPVGGTPGYTYTWSPFGGNSAIANNLSSGNYSVIISDANNCQLTKTVTIIQPNSMTFTVNTTSVTCNGGSNGTASINTLGGTAPYSYTWSPSPGSGQGTSSVSGLSAQIYMITIADNLGCTTFTSASILQPATAISGIATTTNVLCYGGNNGSTSVSANGGTGGYTYSWSPSGGNTASAVNLVAGNYTVLIMDINSCTVSVTANVSQPLAPLGSIISATNILCFGNNNGSAGVIANGGTPGYTYLWSPTGGTNNIASNLSPGNYTVTVKDINNCSISSFTSISQPTAALTASSINSNVTCFGGSNGASTVTANGGVGGYVFNWLPTPVTGSVNAGLTHGTYTVFVNDGNNCTFSLTTIIAQPTPITVNVNAIKLCNGQFGTLIGNVNGGFAPYSYLWNNISGSFSISVNPTATAIYTLSVTDANGCNSPIDTALINVSAPLSLSVSPTKTICAGTLTNLSATAFGGLGTYQYNWMPANISGQTMSVNLNSTTVYTVTASDGCGLPAVATTTVFVETISTPTLLANKYSGCSPVCVNFTNTAFSPSLNIQASLWSFSDGSFSAGQQAQHCFESEGIYTAINSFTTTSGCVISVKLVKNIIVHNKPKASFSSDNHTVNYLNPVINFQNSSVNASTYLWDFAGIGSSSNVNPSFSFNDPGKYLITLIAMNDFCVDTAYNTVECAPVFTFYAPNTFTPNDDNINDVFYPLGEGWDVNSYSMMIFDRWGEKIFNTNHYATGWNGRLKGDDVKEDTYIWKISLKDIFGRQHDYIGHVTVVR